MRLHAQASDEVEHRAARLVDDPDELGADLQQEHERADDDERDPVAETRVGDARLNDRTRTEERGDAPDDQHGLAVAEAELLQAVMQVTFIRREDRLLLDPAADDREERIGQRHPDDEERRHERHDRNLLESEHRQRRESEAEEQRARVSHEDFRGMEVEVQESDDAAEQHRGQHDDGEVAHDDTHHEDGADRDAGDARGEAVEAVDQVDRVRDADDPEDRERHADPFAQRLHRIPERNVQQVDLDVKAEYDDARSGDLHEQLQLGGQVELVVERAEEHDERAARQQRADQVLVVMAQKAVRQPWQ